MTPHYTKRRRAINNDIVCGLQLKVYKIRSSRFSGKEWFVASENIIRHLSTARIETFTSHSNCLKGFKMAKPLLFSLILVASYTVLTEVRGVEHPNPISSPQSLFPAVNEVNDDDDDDDRRYSPSSGHVENVSGDQDDSPLGSIFSSSSFPPNSFGGFRRFGQPIVSRALSGSELKDILEKTLFKDMGPPFQKQTTKSFPSANNNGYGKYSSDQSNNGDREAVGANYGKTPSQGQRYSLKYSSSPAPADQNGYSGKYGNRLAAGNSGAQVVGANGPQKTRQVQQYSPAADREDDGYPRNGGQERYKNGLWSADKSAAGYPQNGGGTSIDDSDGDDKAPVGAVAGRKRFASSPGPSDLHSILSSFGSAFRQGKGTKIDHFDNNGIKVVRVQLSRCCTADNNCYVLEEGEECEFGNPAMNGKNNKQNSETHNDEIFQQLMSSGFGSNDAGISSPGSSRQFSNLGQQLFGGGIKYYGSNSNSGSYEPKSGPLQHPNVTPKGLSEEEAEKIRKYVLEKHNFYRQKHGMSKLTLNKQLSNYAQEWANHLVNRQMEHRPGKDKIYGENIAQGDEIENIGYEVVDQFYDEIALYRPNDDESGLINNRPTHHLTQLLWGWTKTLGVGVSKTPNGKYTIVCNYDPSGNMQGSFKKNLPNITQEQVEEGAAVAEKNKNKYGTKYTTKYRVVHSPMFRTSSGWFSN